MLQCISLNSAPRLATCFLAGVAALTATAAESLETPNTVAKVQTTSPPSSSQPAAKPTVKIAPVMLTPEREAGALQFVREHHPELVDLLKGLKVSHPNQYQAALRQLFQTSERLAKIHEVDPERYEIELQLWKIKSRIQLLAARSSLSRDPEIESQLKAALAEQAQAQLQELQMDRDRIADRLKVLDRSIDRFQTNEQRNIDKQFGSLMHEIDRQRAQAAAKASSSATAAKSPKSVNSTKRYPAKPTVPAKPAQPAELVSPTSTVNPASAANK